MYRLTWFSLGVSFSLRLSKEPNAKNPLKKTRVLLPSSFTRVEEPQLPLSSSYLWSWKTFKVCFPFRSGIMTMNLVWWHFLQISIVCCRVIGPSTFHHIKLVLQSGRDGKSFHNCYSWRKCCVIDSWCHYHPIYASQWKCTLFTLV